MNSSYGSTKLPQSFYTRQDVVQIAKELLGKRLMTNVDGQSLTGGWIIETEAYRGPDDRACHAYNNRRTPRTQIMYQEGGVAYVYMCYGIHFLFNVVTAPQDVAHAVLVRSIIPSHGLDIMMKRRKKKYLDVSLTAGPGSVCQALGISKNHNGSSLSGGEIWIEDTGLQVEESKIQTFKRIGIDYAGPDALRLWRFCLDPKPFLKINN